ncbi:unnamed protein product, partial [Owenia fusiformis]
FGRTNMSSRVITLLLVVTLAAHAYGGKPTHSQKDDDDHTFSEEVIRMYQENILKRNEENKQARMQGKSVGSAEWIRKGQDTVNYAANRGLNTNLAKNVIIFIGDGMGLTTMSAARILRGQQLGGTGEEHQLSWDKFSHSMLAKTYSVNGQTPDSASTANAMLTGVKSSVWVIGVDEEVVPYMCDTVAGHEVDSILRWSKREGKAAGLITTTRPSHATPAAAFAHSPCRCWEGDHQVPEWEEAQCPDITKQLVVNNTDIEVILGGGRSYFMNENQEDPEYPFEVGFREDGRDLIQEWYDHKLSINQRPAYVWNISAFNEVNPANTDYLMGLFERQSMRNDADRIDGDIAGEPSISEMTQKAIEILSKNENGFFLLVEGGRIDSGHHSGRAARALLETIALDRAVETAVNMTSENDTLIVVTADHGHVLAFGGYSERGNPILGKTLVDAADDKPYTTLTYGNGPGYQGVYNDTGADPEDLTTREDLENVDTSDSNYRQQSPVPLSSETHSGEDVIVMANGPMAHLFYGVQEQSYVAHAMAYASCVGENKMHCNRP